MSNHGIEDEDLPEDLKPTDDNPLAQPLSEDDDEVRSAEELDVLEGGKTPDETETQDTDDSED